MTIENLRKEVQFAASRSSGAGGQHVNKVSTRVEIRFDVLASQFLTAEEQILILEKLDNRIVQGHILQFFNQDSRSQMRNRENALLHLHQNIKEALKVEKPRKKTTKSKAADRKRLQKKQQQSLKKSQRAKIDLADYQFSKN